MSSDLELFRDHCRRMQTATHTDECHALVQRPGGVFGPRTERLAPDPACQGCVSSNDRALFASLAKEVDAYLHQPTEPGLWDDQ